MMQGSAPDHDEAHASELTVLGAIMLDNGAYGPAARALTAGSFGDPRHRAIFASMAGLVAADARRDGRVLSVEWVEWLMGAKGVCPRPLEAR